MIAKGSGLWGRLYPAIFGGRNGAAAGTCDGEALGAPSYPAMSPSSNLLLPEIPPETLATPVSDTWERAVSVTSPARDTGPALALHPLLFQALTPDPTPWPGALQIQTLHA